MPLATVVVPPLTFLRKMPALSKRLAPELRENAAEFCTSNRAADRFVMTAPARKIAPEPVQVAVPAFSSVRELRLRVPLLLIRRTAPGTMSVRPEPLMIPPVQFN